MAVGFDVGTYNLVCAKRKSDNEVECIREVNAFIKIPLVNDFTYKMLDKGGVKLLKRPGFAYGMGEKAVEVAYSFGDMELHRPMKDGCVNPGEKEAFSVLATMIHSMIGDLSKNKEVLCYSVPSNAINQQTDADYHKEVLKQIFDKYESKGKRVQALAVNEALALVYAELQDKFLTGLAASFGSGQVNVCFANRSVPVVQFSLVNSGDWIDHQAAKAASVSPTVINYEKTKINLLEDAKNEIERAVITQYKIMIRRTVEGIKHGLEQANVRTKGNEKFDFVVAGGTASPPGFDVLLQQAIKDVGLPITIGTIRRPEDILYAVARGCLEAAEAAEV